MDATTHACLGLTILGQCKAGPAGPYFDLGAAVSALGFTLTVQQLLKPIYKFRLNARYLSLKTLYIIVFAATALVCVGAILPSLPQNQSNPLTYPILWELAATLLFVIAYGAVVIAVVQPVRVRPHSIEQFSRASAWLLSAATDRDQLDYVPDLVASLPTLIKAAEFNDRHTRDTSAFFDFTHRREISRSAHAWSFLRIIADPIFCATLVKHAPWMVATMLREIEEKKLWSKGARQFVREIAKQAILRDDGMMGREVDYHGFGSAPLLSDSLFSRRYILTTYDPFDSFRFILNDQVTGRMLKRFNSAAEKALNVTVSSGDVWSRSDVAYSIQSYSEHLFSTVRDIRKRGDSDLTFQMHKLVKLGHEMGFKLLNKTDKDSYDNQFITDLKNHRFDTLGSLVDIVYDALAFISNDFKGVSDEFWHTGISTIMDAFPSIGDNIPDGMNPFQQRLTIKIIDKLSDNMDGFYPAICTVLLACVGPYAQKGGPSNRTAFNILKDAMYVELQKLKELSLKHPEKVDDYLPDNVTYDAANDTLTHSYRGGAQNVTELSKLEIAPVDFTAVELRQTFDPKEDADD